LRFYIRNADLNTFLYEQDFGTYFLQIMRRLEGGAVAVLTKAITELHTGETLVSDTASLNWNQREEIGQSLLKKLAEEMFALCDRSSRLTSYAGDLQDRLKAN